MQGIKEPGQLAGVVIEEEGEVMKWGSDYGTLSRDKEFQAYSNRKRMDKPE